MKKPFHKSLFFAIMMAIIAEVLYGLYFAYIHPDNYKTKMERDIEMHSKSDSLIKIKK